MRTDVAFLKGLYEMSHLLEIERNASWVCSVVVKKVLGEQVKIHGIPTGRIHLPFGTRLTLIGRRENGESGLRHVWGKH